MKTYIQSLIITLLCVLSTQAMAQEDWEMYQTDQFRVEVPQAMELTSTIVNTSLGDLENTTYTCKGSEEKGSKTYQINSVSYPTGTFPMDSIELIQEYLAAAIETRAASVNGSLVYKTLEKKGEQTVYLYRIKYNSGHEVIKGKAILTADTFYMLQAFCHRDQSLHEDMDYFLNSFKVNL